MRLNRTDAALVRVISPVVGDTADAETRAAGAAVAFTKTIFPLLARYLPN